MTTYRLFLRPFHETDLSRLVEVAGRRQVADTTISVPHPFTAAHAAEWITRCNSETRDGLAAHFTIALREAPDLLIGYVAIKSIDAEHREGELSFWLDEAHAGAGYATEAARAAVAHAFSTLALNRVCAFHMIRNAASARLLARIGFLEEGTLRQRVRKWGVYEDVRVCSILRRDQFLREALPADADAICSVLAAAFEEFRPLYTPEAFAATVPPPAAILTRMQEGPLWVVERDASIAGTVAARCLPDSVLVRGMAVHPGARRFKIAATLLDEIQRFARQQGRDRLTLYTTAFLKSAIRLYERSGFQFTGDTADLHGTELLRMTR